MNKIQKAIQAFHEIDHGAGHHQQDKIHPLARLIVTVCFVVTAISFSKYDLVGLASMALYILIYQIWNEISFRKEICRIWPVLLITCMVGIANPIMEPDPMLYIGTFVITKGMTSMVTLMLKGVLCVMASYCMIMTIGMNGICYGLQCLHVPKIIITSLMLTYRYLIVLLKEAERMWQSYRLRAPRQRGIQMSAWGAFVGQLMLRSIDRSERVYDSILLRGYNGKFRLENQETNFILSVLYIVSWCVIFLLLRRFPVFHIVGEFVVR